MPWAVSNQEEGKSNMRAAQRSMGRCTPSLCTPKLCQKCSSRKLRKAHCKNNAGAFPDNGPSRPAGRHCVCRAYCEKHQATAGCKMALRRHPSGPMEKFSKASIARLAIALACASTQGKGQRRSTQTCQSFRRTPQSQSGSSQAPTASQPLLHPGSLPCAQNSNKSFDTEALAKRSTLAAN